MKGRQERHRPQQFLSLDMISPMVDIAGCWKYESQPTAFRYRVPSHHLMLVESGCVRAAAHDGKPFEARGGDLICFRHRDLNEYHVWETAVFYQIHLLFAPPPNQELTPSLGELGPLPVHMSLGDWFEPMRNVFETLCVEVPQAGAIHQLRVRSAVWDLLTIAAEAMAAQSQPEARPKLDDWDRLRSRLDADLRHEINITELAREMNLNPSYLIRQFKKRFGVSPKAYVTQARLREAVRLLRTTDLPAKTVAFNLGFPSAQAMERVLEHHTGLRSREARVQPIFVARNTSSPELNPFQINQHNLSPEAGPDWHDQFMPRHPRSAAARRGPSAGHRGRNG